MDLRVILICWSAGFYFYWVSWGLTFGARFLHQFPGWEWKCGWQCNKVAQVAGTEIMFTIFINPHGIHIGSSHPFFCAHYCFQQEGSIIFISWYNESSENLVTVSLSKWSPRSGCLKLKCTCIPFWFLSFFFFFRQVSALLIIPLPYRGSINYMTASIDQVGM